MAKVTMAMLVEQIAALQAQIAAAPVVPVKASQFRTKAQRAAGEGWPCTATPPCGRTDLRTKDAGTSHSTKAAHWHIAKA